MSHWLPQLDTTVERAECPLPAGGGSTNWQPGSVCSSRKHTRMLCPDVQAWHCLGTSKLRPANTVQSALPPTGQACTLPTALPSLPAMQLNGCTHAAPLLLDKAAQQPQQAYAFSGCHTAASVATCCGTLQHLEWTASAAVTDSAANQQKGKSVTRMSLSRHQAAIQAGATSGPLVLMQQHPFVGGCP